MAQIISDFGQIITIFGYTVMIGMAMAFTVAVVIVKITSKRWPRMSWLFPLGYLTFLVMLSRDFKEGASWLPISIAVLGSVVGALLAVSQWPGWYPMVRSKKEEK